MAITISCKGDYVDAFTCCAGGTNKELRKGLLIDDSGVETFINIPFFIFEGPSGVIVSDWKGSRKYIPLVDTIYGSIRDLAKAVAACKRPTFMQYFAAPIGFTVMITENGGNLPSDPNMIWIETHNGQAISQQFWTHANNAGSDDTITFAYDEIDTIGIYVRFAF